MPGLLAVVLCLLLAGCAGSGTYRDADADTLDPADLALASLSKDPIGALVSRKHSAQRRQAIGNPMISEALDQLGIRYRYGGTSPDTGFDCSGLVFYSAERALGLKLPRDSSSMALVGTAIDKPELQPGDLVFFNTLGRRYSHVGIYLGDDRFVHSPSSGGVVRIEKITLAYWAKRYNGARRLDGDLLASAGH
ncbi:C40 family peptidase [Bordetella tumulicola]